MSNAQLRQFMRWGHIIVGSMLIAFVYSPALQTSEVYIALLQFAAVPAVGISGLLLWQQPRINKWRRNRNQRGT